MTVHPDTKKTSNDGDRFDQFPKWLWGTPSTKDTPAVQPAFSPTTMLVYVALRSHEGMKDGARPSIKRVSEMTGLGERTIWRSIHELNGAGVLKVESRGKSQPNRYHFPSQRSATVADPQVCHTGRSATQADRVCHSGTPRSATQAAERDLYRETEGEKPRVWFGAAPPRSLQGEETNPASPGVSEGGEGQDPDPLDSARSAEGNGPSVAEENSGATCSVPNYLQQPSMLVELFNNCRVDAGFRPGSEKVRKGSWLDSARIPLHKHSYEELAGLIRWVCANDYWSKEIGSLYALGVDPRTKRPRYDELLAESKSRAPRRRRSGGYRPPGESLTSEEGKALDAQAAANFARLEDLGDLDNVDPSGDFASLRARLGLIKEMP